MSGFSAHLWRMWRSGRNTTHRLVIEQPLRGLSMLIVLSTVWALLSALFFGVLHFLGQEQYVAFKERLLESLLGVFCFALFFLVLISDVVVVWAGLFRSRSALFLAQTPSADRHLFWGASLEGAIWSTWAVLVLALPLIGSLANEAAEPLLFIPAATLALGCFIACAVATGSLAALLLARLIPLLRRGLPGIIALVVSGFLIGLVFVVGGIDHNAAPTTVVQEVVGKLSFTGNPLLPSAWARDAIMSAQAARWSMWGHHMLLLVTTAAGLAIIAEWMAHRRLRRDLDAVCGHGDRQRAARTRVWRPVPYLPADLGLLAAKDFRLFIRDPAQILQFTMFFGLLGFYLLMLPRLGKAFLLDEQWRPMVSLLNLTAIAMALATFTGRFVFPLLSLEGRRLWVLALAPMERSRIVTAKYAFALLVGVPVSVTLVTLSGIMLELRPALIAFQGVVMLGMAMGLAAGALGLGARFADYNEDNPGKLVAGYGGNVNLLASLMYTAFIMAGAAMPVLFGDDLWWAWPAAGLWVALVATLWSSIFLRMAWRDFQSS